MANYYKQCHCKVMTDKVPCYDCLEAENKRLRELLKDAVSGHDYSWEWKHPSIDWVEVQISKRALIDIDKFLEGGGSDGF